MTSTARSNYPEIFKILILFNFSSSGHMPGELLSWVSVRQHQKSGGGPSNEHFWQVWLKSVQRFQRRRFKCEKLTDGQTDDYP
jgi:hypothetical protein